MKKQVNYKKIALIPNFNPKKGYPEFSKKEEVVVKAVSEPKVKRLKKTPNLELKAAKKVGTWRNGLKPVLLKKVC